MWIEKPSCNEEYILSIRKTKEITYNSKQKIEVYVHIFFNITFLSNFILNESVCFVKTFRFIVFLQRN